MSRLSRQLPCVDSRASCTCGFSVPCRNVVTHLCAHAKPGLGDMVAAGLAAVGITPERVSAVIGKDCGCSKRKQALNDLGRRIGIG